MENKDLIMNNEEVETGSVTDVLEENYSPRISETLGYSEEYMDAMQRNYPYMTREEIIKAIENQKDYLIFFHHRHEGITGDLIKKYLVINTDDYGYWEKITLETPEIHDCNLVKLTPELQDKAYRGYRGNRDVVSHLIDRKDYPWENKTNKLTIIGKRDHRSYYDEDLDEQVEYDYFYVITAFWGDGSSRKEPKISDGYPWEYNMDEVEYWMNHALIPETNETITRMEAPYRLAEYYEKKGKKKSGGVEKTC